MHMGFISCHFILSPLTGTQSLRHLQPQRPKLSILEKSASDVPEMTPSRKALLPSLVCPRERSVGIIFALFQIRVFSQSWTVLTSSSGWSVEGEHYLTTILFCSFPSTCKFKLFSLLFSPPLANKCNFSAECKTTAGLAHCGWKNSQK